MSYIDGIKEKAKADIKTIVLPESDDDRTMLAAADILRNKIANLILVGNKESVQAKCDELHINLSNAKVVDPMTDPESDNLVNMFYELRKAKGMTPEKAKETITGNYIYYGVMMLKAGMADGLVAGACHATADTLRPALQILKTAPGVKMVSGFFILDVPGSKYGSNGTFLFADAGLNQDPTAEELAVIAGSSATSFRQLVDDEPRVAFLSHSTKGSAKHTLVDKVVEAARLAKEMYPDVKSDGELQLDAAIVPEVAASKAPGSEVAGKANVLIFPNLDAGNIGYKLVQRLGLADAYGPMLQGIAKPVNDLSRGCSWQDIVGVVALTCVQAQIV